MTRAFVQISRVLRGCGFVWALLMTPSLWAQSVGPIGIPTDPNVQLIAHFANGRVDYAQVQAAIEKMANPAFDTAAFDAALAHWATVIQKRIPAHAKPTQVMEAMGEVLYTPGPWNDQHPFTYDLSDPLAKNNATRFVSAYLRTRKGNCVSMPTLLVILGQKLGLNMTLARAPEHEFARLQDTNGRWFNIEATSPASPPDEKYINELHISPPVHPKRDLHAHPDATGNGVRDAGSVVGSLCAHAPVGLSPGPGSPDPTARSKERRWLCDGR